MQKLNTTNCNISRESSPFSSISLCCSLLRPALPLHPRSTLDSQVSLKWRRPKLNQSSLFVLCSLGWFLGSFGGGRGGSAEFPALTSPCKSLEFGTQFEMA